MNEHIQKLIIEAGFPEWSNKTIGFELETFAELIVKESIEQLTSGPGGIMEMKQTIANLEEKLEKIASHHIPGVIPDGYTMTEWILKNYNMLRDIARG